MDDLERLFEEFQLYLLHNQGYEYNDGFQPCDVIWLMRQFFKDNPSYMVFLPMTQEDFENDKYA